MIRGIDISHNNGQFDFSTFPADIAFIAMKASEGITVQDPNFQNNYHQVKNELPDVKRIAYHFYRWQDDPIAQADNLLSRGVNYSEPGVLPPLLDLESNGDEIDVWMAQNLQTCIDNVTAFVNYIKQQTTRDCMIYSFDSFLKYNLGNASWPQCVLWISSFQDNPPPYIPGWQYSFWQYSQYGQLDGTTTGGSLDLDQYMGTQDQLDALANSQQNA